MCCFRMRPCLLYAAYCERYGITNVRHVIVRRNMHLTWRTALREWQKKAQCLIHARLLISRNGKVGSEQFEAAAMTGMAILYVTLWRRVYPRKMKLQLGKENTRL